MNKEYYITKKWIEDLIKNESLDTATEQIWTEITRIQDYTKDLERQSKKLDALESAGVDNWSGYDYAMDLLK